jgi:hypothetical protein
MDLPFDNQKQRTGKGAKTPFFLFSLLINDYAEKIKQTVSTSGRH